MERVAPMVYRFQLREAGSCFFETRLWRRIHMGSKRGPVGLLVLTAAFLVFAFGASPAKAAFGIAEWEALTCKENTDTPALGGTLVGAFPLAPPAGQCTDETPEKFFTQATGHPTYGITDFTLNTLPAGTGGGFPEGFVKDIVVDTPEGLGVNPEATLKKCTVAQLSADPPECPPESIVGTNYFTVSASPLGPACEPPAGCLQARAAVPVYNLVPFDGVPSMVGFPTSAPGEPTLIVGDLDPKDQHVRFNINDIHAPDGTAEHPPIVGSRLVFVGSKAAPSLATNGTYLTMPSNCAGGQTSTLHVTSHTGAEDFASYTTSVGADECESAPFNVQLGASSSGSTDSPEPSTVDVKMPDQLAPETRANSHLLTAKVTLPEGAGLNPSVANGLNACTDAQFKKGTDDPIECPAASRIGSIEVETPALDQDLGGDVYVGQPLNNDPSSGDQFRVFLHAFNDRYGVNVRLIGNVFPNLDTGQLTVVVPNNPQAPFSSFKVNVDGGPTGALTTPDTCGPHTTTAQFTPWSRPGEQVPPQSGNPQFSLTTLPTGGPCPATLADRPFEPYFASAPTLYKAGEFTEFRLDVVRQNGNQEVKRVDVKLPPGMVAKLRGLEYCSQADINAAGLRSGASVIAEPACPDSSFVGTAEISVGSGQAFHTEGKAYLSGPYKGAPVSLVFVTPAVAGPYDLGNVVVRTALNVDPETAEVHAVSDPIPNVFGGVKLDIRQIRLYVTRPNFTTNPTTCREPLPIRTSVFGGGGNPADPNAWQEASNTDRLQFGACRKLGFKPKFYARIFGGKNQTKRGQNPKFRAILKARKGDANLRRAAFILPRATILDQSHIKTICTRVQLAANNCPKNSIYGNARATSPLLDGVLKGPVYLTSSSNELPDLLVDLKGQVPIRLRGVISSKNARLKTVFNGTPDVAVNKFILTMKGGNRGLLINSRNLCASRTSGFLNLLAQNSRRERNKNLRLNIPACRGGKQN
ncbi:MAG TPA: hypothetical protein VFT19_02915 [Solirubrobacterales bacterium]|nr:hypothetical protein [Solirubrobacterales bacterium]